MWDLKYPSISDLRLRAKKRIPHFAFEYLDSGTGAETAIPSNRTALDEIKFLPSILHGEPDADIGVTLFGERFSLPFGIAPVGMSGLIWPNAERFLAQTAVSENIPFCLSTVATQLPEDIGPISGEHGWFQLYAPADPEIRQDMLARIWAAGFRKLILTVDVPGESRRERQRRALLSLPPKIRAPMLASMLTCPTWLWNTLRVGRPSVKFPESYVSYDDLTRDALTHAGRIIRGYPDWNYLDELRNEWQGKLIIKGVLDPQDGPRLVAHGVDAIWVSNHSGRQFDAGPSSIEQLPKIRAAIGPDFPIIFDSGIAGGLDILRALALGADFVMLGRGFHYALGALGAQGPKHLCNILSADIRSNMAQIGAQNFAELARRLI